MSYHPARIIVSKGKQMNIQEIIKDLDQIIADLQKLSEELGE